jgi:glycosyltransferase involved in cell wall biosynthesis
MTGGDRVIAVSDHIRQYTLYNYPSTDPARLVTVHGGISHQAFPFGYRPAEAWRKKTLRDFPELANRRLVCLPGRLSRYKGHADFIELASRLLSDVPDLQGVIVGKARPGSRYRDELEGLAKQYGVLDRITFAGARLDIRDWMAASEIVYSLCSDPPEAFGRTVPEALHLGVPVIGWDHGGVQETLAVLFPQGAVRPGDRKALLDRSRAFLAQKPVVSRNPAFGLRESMEKTMVVYQSVQLERNQ